MLEHDQRTNLWAVSTGVLKSFDGIVRLAEHVFIHDTADGGLSVWLAATGDEQLKRFSRGSSSVEINDVNPPPQQSDAASLHAHCDCKGVEFYVSRPSAQSRQTSAAWPDALVPFHVEERPSRSEPWWLRAGETKYFASTCVCNSCRLAIGNSEIQQWAFIPKVNLSLSSDAMTPMSMDLGTIKWYRSSAGARRGFCRECGATIFWLGDDRPTLIDVSVGLLEADEGARAETWLEWHTGRVSYREDAIDRAHHLTRELEEGLKAWGVRTYGEDTIRK